MSRYINAVDAAGMWCPYARVWVQSRGGGSTSVNRGDMSQTHQPDAIASGATCIIDLCVKWEWKNEKEDNPFGRCSA